MKKLQFLFLALAMFFIFPLTVHANSEDTWDEIEAISKQENSINKTEKMGNKYKQIVETSDYSLDKTITAFGDSITDFGGWVDAAKDITGCNIYNLGIGGSAIGDYWDDTSLILRWSQIPSDSDIIIIFAGINDFFIGDDFGDKGISQTYCGDTWSLFNNIKATYPEADIFVVTTYRTESENWEQFNGRSAEPYMEIQKQYADELGLHVIDIFGSGYLDSRDSETQEKYMPDGVHTNEDGAELLAYAIISELLKYYEN